MDDNKARREWAVKVFQSLGLTKEKRLKHGAEQRAKMKASINAGKKVEGYRADWIIDTMNQVIKTISLSAEKFNNTYAHDMISVDDFQDVLSSAVNKLKTKNKKN